MKKFLILALLLLASAVEARGVLMGVGSSGLTFSTTWNSADSSGPPTYSNGNLTVTSNAINQGTRGTLSASKGKFYFEVNGNGGGANDFAGIASGSASLTSGQVAGQAGINNGGRIVTNGTQNTAYLGPCTSLRFAIDLGNSLMWAECTGGGGGNWNNNAMADPVAGTNGIDISSITGSGVFPLAFMAANGSAWTGNFGASAFTFSVPSGFTAGWAE